MSEPVKIKGDYKSWTVTQTLFGKIVNLTQQRINQLIEEEIVIRDPSSKGGAVFLIESLQNFYASKNNSEVVNFWTERGLHEKAKRELAELKLREKQGELYDAATVENVVTEAAFILKTNLQGLPAKLAPALEKKTANEVVGILRKEIEVALNELSEKLTEYISVDAPEPEC